MKEFVYPAVCITPSSLITIVSDEQLLLFIRDQMGDDVCDLVKRRIKPIPKLDGNKLDELEAYLSAAQDAIDGIGRIVDDCAEV